MWEGVTITHQTVEQAAREVIEISAGARVLRAKHSTDPDGEFAELVGTISMLGPMGGTLVAYCSWAEAVALASGMLGATTEPDRETVQDALGEIINQIGGTIKRRIEADGSEILLSPPVVVSGSPLSHCVKATTLPLSVEMELEIGHFAVCLWPS
jgi:CheY-specific phosphatase CheX